MFSAQGVQTFEDPEEARLRRHVSQRSAFGDDSWYLDAKNPARPKHAIHWTRCFPSGNSLNAPEYASLLNACKEYLYLRLHNADVLPILKPSTAATQSKALLAVCDWMISAGLHAFRDIGQSEVDQLRALFRSSLGWWHARAKRVVGTEKRSNRTVELNLDPLRAMVIARELLTDVPNWNPALDRGRLNTNEGKQEVPAIPDAISIPLFAEALRWVTEIGPTLVKAKETIWESYGIDRAAWRRTMDRTPKNERDALRRLAFRDVTGSITINSREIELSSLSRREFNSIVVMLEAACFIVIAGFTGMRISELSGVELDCLHVVRSSNGQARLELKTGLVKTVAGDPEANMWIAGYDTPDNPVRIAVDVARAIASVERDAYELKALFLVNAYTYRTVEAETEKAGRPKAMTDNAMNRRLNQFLQFVELDTSWHLTTHQFRKTFARFVARHHAMALLALKRHFKHVSLAMTELYRGTDTQLLELIGEERRAEAEEALEDILGSAFLGGKMGEQIVKKNERFRGHAGAIELKSYVRALMNNGDVPMISTLIGFCFAFPDTARCGLDVAKQGFEGCLPCSNFIVSARHLPAWKERLSMMDTFREQMIAGGVWSEERQMDWQRRRESTRAVIEGLERQSRERADSENARAASPLQTAFES